MVTPVRSVFPDYLSVSYDYDLTYKTSEEYHNNETNLYECKVDYEIGTNQIPASCAWEPEVSSLQQSPG